MDITLSHQEDYKRLRRLRSATGVAYPTGYFFFRATIYWVARLFMKSKIYHQERLPQPRGIKYRPPWYRRNGSKPIGQSKGYIIAANHGQLWDIALVGLFKRGLVWICKPYFCAHPLAAMINQRMGAVPVFRPSIDGDTTRNSIKKAKKLKMASYSSSETYIIAVDALNRGVPVEMFPEGTRLSSASIDRSKHGAAKIARLSGCSILPLAIVGLSKGDPKIRTKLMRRRVVIGLVGHAISPASFSHLGDIYAIESAMMEAWQASINALKQEGQRILAN